MIHSYRYTNLRSQNFTSLITFRYIFTRLIEQIRIEIQNFRSDPRAICSSYSGNIIHASKAVLNKARKDIADIPITRNIVFARANIVKLTSRNFRSLNKFFRNFFNRFAMENILIFVNSIKIRPQQNYNHRAFIMRLASNEFYKAASVKECCIAIHELTSQNQKTKLLEHFLY